MRAMASALLLVPMTREDCAQALYLVRRDLQQRERRAARCAAGGQGAKWRRVAALRALVDRLETALRADGGSHEGRGDPAP